MRGLVCILAVLLCMAAAPDTGGIGFTPHPGAVLPDARLTDSRGNSVDLRRLSGTRPSIIALGYYHCPNLCGVVRSDMFAALQASGLTAGRDYDAIALSIDPHETPHDAATAKAADIARFPVPGANAGWHFLTGDSTAVAKAIGYTARWDAQLKQFMHPTGLVVATPGGIVSAYLLGVGYTPDAVAGALRRAAAAFVAPPPSPVLLLCFHYDPATGHYTLAIERVLRLFALLTVATVAGLIAFLQVKRPRA